MPKKIKFDVDLSEGNTLFGIACHKKDYWMAYQLNRVFNIKLRRLPDFPQLDQKGDVEDLFPLFYAACQEKQQAFFLLPNSNKKVLLFPGLSSTDFFLLVQGALNKEDVGRIVAALRGITGVLTAFVPDTQKLKGYPLFLSDLELFSVSVLSES